MTVIRHSNLHGVSKHAMMTVAILKLVESYALQQCHLTKSVAGYRDRIAAQVTVDALNWQEHYAPEKLRLAIVEGEFIGFPMDRIDEFPLPNIDSFVSLLLDSFLIHFEHYEEESAFNWLQEEIRLHVLEKYIPVFEKMPEFVPFVDRGAGIYVAAHSGQSLLKKAPEEALTILSLSRGRVYYTEPSYLRRLTWGMIGNRPIDEVIETIKLTVSLTEEDQQ